VVMLPFSFGPIIQSLSRYVVKLVINSTLSNLVRKSRVGARTVEGKRPIAT
jgi:hypothetical protein